MTRQITGELFRSMMINAAAAIETHKNEINELNVFPVPDGDTGTNMSLTMGAGAKALEDMTSGSVGHASDVAAGALLRGARGNSGVILSLLFRGLARSLKDADSADAVMIANALAAGVDSAYKAVMKPAEGTILTVSRVAAAGAAAAAEAEDDIEFIFEQAVAAGEIALSDTINQNPVLKKAGVIDAGGKGYIYIIDGMLRALRGEVIEKPLSEQPGEKADFTEFTAEDIKFTYCTEFMVERESKKDTNRLREFLDARGDSIVVVEDDEVIKTHVHTNEPGAVITEALTYGSFISIKIENMRRQHSEAMILSAGSAVPGQYDRMKEFGTVVVCAGEGIEAVFRDLGADNIITGGQTMNPSTEDILDKINMTPAETVFVLPNNKNIIMAAQQCIPLTKKHVVVIPTRSIPQGVAAMLATDGAETEDDIASAMTEGSSRVRTALVTRAARDSVFDGHDMKEGEYLALIDDSLAASGPDADAVVDAVAAALGAFSPEFITIFTGEDADEAGDARERIAAVLPGADITVIHGGQPVYHYIISAE